MTTPENFRRRQRIEGTALLILGLVTVLFAVYFHAQDVKQRECLNQQVHEITASFRARADLVDRDSHIKTEVISAVARAKSQADVAQALSRYLTDQREVDQARADTPTPTYPAGECQ